MKLLEQLLREAGADVGKTITVIPSFGGYFASVKRVDEYTPEKIVLQCGDKKVTVLGKKLIIDKYFAGDLSVRGSISGVSVE